MKNFIIIAFLTLFFVGCSTTSLDLSQNNKLVIQKSNISYTVDTQKIDDNFLYFKDLFIEQYKLENQKNQILFYENIYTTTDYEFNFSELYTVMYSFDVKEYEEIYSSNNLNFFQLKLKNKSYINIIIFSNETQNISYAYGFSNKDFLKIIQKVKSKEDKELLVLKYNGIVFDLLSKPLSRWDDYLIYFTPLITPVRYYSLP